MANPSFGGIRCVPRPGYPHLFCPDQLFPLLHRGLDSVLLFVPLLLELDSLSVPGLEVLVVDDVAVAVVAGVREQWRSATIAAELAVARPVRSWPRLLQLLEDLDQ